MVALALWLTGTSAFSQTNVAVYTDSLQNGWQDWGWATINYNNTNPVHSGSDSISVTCGAFQAVYMHNAAFLHRFTQTWSSG